MRCRLGAGRCAVRRAVVALLLLALLRALLRTTRDADALTLAPMSLEELAGSATLVVRARCLDRQATRGDGGRVESLVRFTVLERAKGEAPDVVTVRQPGGRIDDLEMVVPGAPRSEPGDDVVLFLEPREDDTLGVVGLALGYMPVIPLPGSGATVRTSRTLGSVASPGGVMPLADLLAAVRAITAGTGRR